MGVSAISCWEVAKLVEYDRLELTIELETWMRAALRLPGVRRMGLTPQIAIELTQLPGSFHSDPADRIIVAKARLHDVDLVAEDQKIKDYGPVQVL